MFSKKVLILTALAAGLAVSVLAIRLMDDSGRAVAGGNAGSPALTVSPNPVPNGATSITISGSGFRSGQMLTVGPRGVIPSVEVTTDSRGAFSITYSPWNGGFTMAGDYPVDAVRHRGNRSIVVATTSFQVCSTNPC